ncbi:MAG TPA: FAD-linked oxidase C-terminal domain-containing protein [Pyrinomonadaceae bacterium]|nr:FAD-linked oxidase C-terminal domain-containing protein [Pyrinomonadaceae bacterium]
MAASPQQFPEDDHLVGELRDIVGDENVLSEPDELLVYECDGLPQHKHLPRAVVFPNSTEETADVLALLHDEGVSFAPRGAGTGLSGGALAINRGVVIELARMRKILKVDTENRLAQVQTGLVNAQLSRAVAPYGLYYVPDPSSQPSCTIGGNIAENAGGIHCLKYGTTTDHVVAARVVLADGSIVDLDLKSPGYDLLGAFVGSEGTFGIATEATVKLVPIPAAVRTLLADFMKVEDASRAVSAIIAEGMLPAALEMMDNAIIRAIEANPVFAAGMPIDAGAVLLVELDGIEAGIDDDVEKVEAILHAHGARSVRRANDEKERKKLWAARKGAFGAVGRLMPDVMIQDAVVPRSRLPEVLAETYRISSKYNLQLANVFHAGDGNLHPLICFDLRRGDDLNNVREAGREIMETCVRAGGSITGEHGVGLDKASYLPLIFSEDDMSAMLQVRAAFDPSGLCNPGKIIPAPGGCGEGRAVATHSVSEPGAVATGSGGPFEGTPSTDSRLRADPVATARGSDAPEGLARRNFVPHPNPLTKGEGETSASIRQPLLAARMNETRVARELSRLLGDVGVRRLADYTLDLQSSTRAERLIEVTPASAEQAAEAMQFAARAGLAVVPAGARTFVEAGNLMSRADLILSTRRMDRLIAHEPADLVATAEAGLPLIEFQKQLAQNGQWLPVDPADDGSATLGGIIATGSSGPQSFGYGPLRSFVIGLRVVLADGRQIKAGGRVVKNVAGYDLCKLFTGSFGTLGLITEVTFKLRPLPVETRTIVAVGSREALLVAGRLAANNSFPVAVEVVSPLLAETLALQTPPGKGLLLIRFAGSTRTVITQTAQALKALRDENFRCALYDDDAALWQVLGSAPLQTNYDLGWSARVRPTELPGLVDEIGRLESDEAWHSAVRWHASAGDGRLRVMARSPLYHQEAARALEGFRQTAEDRGGSLIVERAPIEVRRVLDAWGSFGSADELMRRVKQQMDPDNVLSPGRFQ